MYDWNDLRYFLELTRQGKLVRAGARLQVDHTTVSRRITAREKQIMRLLAEGLSVKEIAAKLYISRKTVENHRSNIMNKLGLHNAIELIRYAARLGLIDVDLWKE